ncbi:iron chelate uptake ABC transporter family permease subunit [Paeniglutamicibacter sp. ABSL32-1]|uniref:iron chelate uptake ABC transporter family permease subunit n=1 Tax=Paeniglutamicibacter quisquiliarum TaxID=2849498 RepID=UPI001C2D177B|nr:iron chelate uptake ABC transporter family permease subunit [Paeniglutamicibacter quisquiliarum]MBV1780496.1 iron chelate uptake ABC transporter family permease subunit [Paeniglutamicibacter quisquiliarum]
MPKTLSPSSASAPRSPGPAGARTGFSLRSLSPKTISPRTLIIVMALATVACIAVFMTLELRGNLSYALTRRGIRVGAMLVVAVAVGLSTLMFQTVTANRILTPSIMGFDALYILIQTALVFVLGSSTLLTADPALKFAIEVVLMVVFSALLYRWLFTGGTGSLHLMLLVGIVIGTLFRGFSSLLQRLMEPSEYIVLQDLFFASFNQVDPVLLLISAVIVALVAGVVWKLRKTFDVLALGRDTAVNLGVDHRRIVTLVLVLCSILVAISTALVGPVTFFGLLVVSLAYQMVRKFSHAALIPIVCLLGAITLIGGQLVLERVFGFATALSVIIEFAGGLLFLYLLLKGSLK